MYDRDVAKGARGNVILGYLRPKEMITSDKENRRYLKMIPEENSGSFHQQTIVSTYACKVHLDNNLEWLAQCNAWAMYTQRS